MPEFSSKQKVSRLRIYVGESDRWRGRPLYAAVLDELHQLGMAGATVFRGAAGFGAHSRMHTSAIVTLSTDLPIVIETIDTPEKISAALEVLYPMVSEGLITRDEVELIKYTHRYLNPLPADKPVAGVMTREVIHFAPETPVFEVWKQMVEKEVKAAPVIDSTGRVCGIITDEDLLEGGGIRQRLSIAIRLDPDQIRQELNVLEKSSQTIRSLMTSPAVTVDENDSLALATTRMIHSGLKRLPVVNADGKLVGMISRLDVLRQVVQAPQPPRPAEIRAGAITTVRDVMTHDFPTVSQDDDLETMVEKFIQANSTRLIVVDEAGQAVGLLSDSDVVARIHPEKQAGILAALRQLGKPPSGRETAFDLMSPGVSTISPHTAVIDAARQMLQESRKWLVVVDEHSMPVGLVDRQILLESLTSVYR